MTASRAARTSTLLLCALATPLLAAEPLPCACPDMLDLANRNRQVKTAIQAYEQKLADVTFEVRQAWMMRERQPPYGPLLVLPIYVGETQETRHMKGPRGCPRTSDQIPFWSEQFKLGKTLGYPADAPDSRSGSPTGNDVAVLIEDWNFLSASGDEAEKSIEQPCTGMGGMGGLAGMPAGGMTCEWTKLKLKRKR